MLILFTGQPGNGKTLNAIKYVREEFKDRKVYAAGIPGLQYEDWHHLETGADWMSCDDGSLIIIDEAHEYMPVRQAGKAVPPCVEALAKHRHRGIDIVLITQHPKSIDVEARRRVGRHFHLKRKFGTPFVVRWEFNECKEEIDWAAQRDGVKTTIKLDSKYYDAYKSAEVHTHTSRLPKKVAVGIPLVLIVAGFLIYSAFGTLMGLGSGDEQFEIADIVAVPESEPPPTSLRSFQEQDWIDYWTPRVAGISWTAPVYDEMLKPASFPKPNCIATAKKCVCYTQQATKMPIPEAVCRDIVNNGWFDPTRKDQSDRHEAYQPRG